MSVDGEMPVALASVMELPVAAMPEAPTEVKATPVPIAELPVCSTMVWLAPPLLAKEPSIGSAELTMVPLKPVWLPMMLPCSAGGRGAALCDAGHEIGDEGV